MKKIPLILALIISGMSVNAQLSQHGLVLNGGTGFIDLTIDKSSPYVKEYRYKYGVSAGYRLRFKTPAPKSFHYDVDVNLGMNALKSKTYGIMIPKNDEAKPTPSNGYITTTQPRFFTSIDGTVNYSIIENLSVGLGVEPTYYFRYNKFDTPIVAKVAYKFKTLELGVTGKYGFMNVLDAEYLKSLKLREIQMYVFIPF